MTFNGEGRILNLWLNAQTIASPCYLNTHNPRGSCKYLELLCVFNTVKLYDLAINHLICPVSTWKQVLIKFLQSVLLITDKRAKRAINVVDCIPE